MKSSKPQRLRVRGTSTSAFADQIRLRVFFLLAVTALVVTQKYR